MFGDWKVQIVEVPGMITSKVYLFQYLKEYTEFLTNKGDIITVKAGELRKEDNLYFTQMTPDQLQAFAEALASKGIKTNKDSIAEGKLTATEKHLNDMRRLVFKNK